MNCKNVCMQSILTLFLVLPSALCLNCFACLPSLAGGTVSQEVALKWISNITRVWNERRQSNFGYCTDLSQDQKFQVTCPNLGERTACIVGSRHPIGSSIPDWEAMSCGVQPLNVASCTTDSDRVQVCYCTSDYCNKGTVMQNSALTVTFITGLSIYKYLSNYY